MTNPLVRQMLDVIERDYSQVLTLRTLAASVGRQPAYLGRLFQQEIGFTAREHVTRVRLEHAAHLIRDGVKIEAVASSVGYRSKKNFYRQFRRHYGTTPIPYRVLGGGGERATLASATPADTGPVRASRDGQSPGSPALMTGGLAAVVRASTRALRLAVRTQRLMVERFSRLHVGVILTNDAGLYVCANPAAMATTGYSPAELYELPPGKLFVSGPARATRCVWDLLMVGTSDHGQPPNATIRTKAGDTVAVYSVTLHNFLWGRREMRALLADLPVVRSLSLPQLIDPTGAAQKDTR